MRGPEFSQKPKVEKIRLPAKRGWLKPFGTLPWKIHYSMVGPRDDNDIVTADDPARHMLTPDTGGGYSLSIFLHRSVPKEFRHIVVFHELKEAEVARNEGIEPKQAHFKTTSSTDDYARQYLTPEQFVEFKKWEKALLDKMKRAKSAKI